MGKCTIYKVHHRPNLPLFFERIGAIYTTGAGSELVYLPDTILFTGNFWIPPEGQTQDYAFHALYEETAESIVSERSVMKFEAKRGKGKSKPPIQVGDIAYSANGCRSITIHKDINVNGELWVPPPGLRHARDIERYYPTQSATKQYGL